MEDLMLAGWTPVLLIALVIAAGIYYLSRKLSRKSLLLTSIVLSLICFGAVIYGYEVVGGWEGIGILYVSFTVFIAIWIGTIMGAMIKK